MTFYQRIQHHPALALLAIVIVGSLLTILIPFTIDGQWSALANTVTHLTDRRWHDVAVILSAIVLESFPFILLGSMVSGLVEVFIPTGGLFRIIPTGGTGVIIASLLGLVLPICDCGTAPIVRKLLEKGKGQRIATAFMLASPTINPITLISTYYAFGGDIHWPILRGIGGLLVAWIVSLSIPDSLDHHSESRTRPSASLERFQNAPTTEEVHLRYTTPVIDRMRHFIPHTMGEFYRVMPTVVLSASVTAVLQVFIPLDHLFGSSQSVIITLLAAILIAVVFSLCSQADAFIARSLSALIPNHGILAFMLAGQTIDLRTIFVFSDILRKKVLIRIVLTTTSAILITCFALSFWRYGI